MIVMAWVGLAAAAESVSTLVRLECDGQSGLIDSHLAFARDPTGEVCIEGHQTLDWFAPDTPPGTIPAFGYTPDAIWARVDVENASGKDFVAVVELSHARLREVTWFVLDGGRVVKEVSAGLGTGGKPDGMAMRYPSVSMALPAGAVRSVYLRVRSDTAIWMPLEISNVLGHARHAAKRDFRDQVFVGIGTGILLLAVLNAWVLRSRLFWLLAGIVAGVMGYYLIFHGYYVWLGGPWQGWVNRKFMISLGLFGHWGFLSFTREYAQRDIPERGLLVFADRFAWVLLAGGTLLWSASFRAGILILLGLLGVCHILGAAMAFRGASTSRAWGNWVLAGVWAVVLGVVFLLYAGSFKWFSHPVGTMELQRSLMLLIFLVFFALVTAQQQSVRRESERAQRAEKLASEAQLRALRYQLNPHFLFNTLNSIGALSREAPGRIPELVRRLALLLRQRLRPEPANRVPLRGELEAVKAYLGIEKVRFEENLQVAIDVPAELLDVRVPEMLIEPLAENAIKYGMPSDGPLRLAISAERREGELVVRVAHNGKLAPSRPGGGIGTRNMRERLEHFYGGRAGFDLREEEGRVVAEVRLPDDADEEGKA